MARLARRDLQRRRDSGNADFAIKPREQIARIFGGLRKIGGLVKGVRMGHGTLELNSYRDNDPCKFGVLG